MNTSKTAAFLLLIYLFSLNVARADEILVNKVVGAKEELILSILQLAIKKIKPEAKIVHFDKEIPIGRLVEDTDSGRIDLMWAGSSAELDEKLLAVRIPLLKGLLGHRIFIIRKGEQQRFNHIQSLEELSKFKAGMGAIWGSTKVLVEAGLPVEPVIKYDRLFHMLDGERFDYFPRAVHEPWFEIAERPNLPLDVEKRLLLIYPYAMYFYVQKDNRALHSDLSRGLEMAIADGSFDKHFYSNPMIKAAVEKANFSQRVVIRIDNPAMHKDTPVDRPELWLDVENL